MPLAAGCPRCPMPLAPGEGGHGWSCPTHGPVAPLWRPETASYDGFVEHLEIADGFPTYLPWPMGPGWSVSDFGVVAGRGGAASATMSCSSGTSRLDGPVDVLVVTEEAGTGLGARCAGLRGDGPGAEVRDEPPVVKVHLDTRSVPLWAVSTSFSDHELDRSVLAGEAGGRWLWMVVRPAAALLLLRDDWILRDVSRVGPPLVEMSFGGPTPQW
jgi:hypothetical protein